MSNHIELIKLLLMTQREAFAHCHLQLPTATVFKDQYIYVEGHPDSTIMLVAHLDTIGTPTSKQLQVNNNILSTDGSTPLGADDRAGIYAALEIYRRASMKPHVLLTCDEECGGLGATEFTQNKELINTLSPKLHLMIELDRKGCNEYVTYDDALEAELTDYIEGFGFKSGYGSYSDIATIGPVIRVPSVNLSVGYYNQHTGKETLHIDEMELTISRCLRMTELQPPRTKYVEHERHWRSKYRKDDPFNSDVDWLDDWRDTKDEQIEFVFADEEHPVSQIIEELIGADHKCDDCGLHWTDCDCGGMAEVIEGYLTEDEFWDLCMELDDAPVLHTINFEAWRKETA